MKTLADNLTRCEGIKHGFFGARGGVSKGFYESLNCGLGSQDDPAFVRQNREKVALKLGVEEDHLLSPYQVHSGKALIVDRPWETGETRPQVDALVTKTRGLAIGVLTADCAPVLFCDPHAKVIGAAHAGWRGAIGGVLDETIEKMCALGANKGYIRACVGPAISLANYEVGEEFRTSFVEKDPTYERYFMIPPEAKKPHFDLSAFAHDRLGAAGLEHTQIIDHCTFGRASHYFSFRRSQSLCQNDYGRQISAIVIL